MGKSYVGSSISWAGGRPQGCTPGFDGKRVFPALDGASSPFIAHRGGGAKIKLNTLPIHPNTSTTIPKSHWDGQMNPAIQDSKNDIPPYTFRRRPLRPNKRGMKFVQPENPAACHHFVLPWHRFKSAGESKSDAGFKFFRFRFNFFKQVF